LPPPPGKASKFSLSRRQVGAGGRNADGSCQGEKKKTTTTEIHPAVETKNIYGGIQLFSSLPKINVSSKCFK